MEQQKSFRTRAEIRNHLKRVLDGSSKRKASQTQEGEREEKRRRDDQENLSGDGDSSGSTNSQDQDAESENEDESVDVRNDEAIPHPRYSRGRVVYEDDVCRVFVKAVAHRKRTRYSLSDHLFNLWVETKRNITPLIFDLEFALEKALVHVLDRLRSEYNASQNQNQVYITVLEKNILHGLNSGNYSLNTPSQKIARWVLSMLYNYLKSDQTLRLNDSFKIQIKVLSFRHVRDLEQRRANFRRHIFH